MKTKNIFLTLALALSTTFAFAQISGSSHDFNAWAVNGGTEASLCDACHTPHGSTATVGAPLWNHAASTGVTSFDTYTSTTLQGTMGDPSGTSLLCLSCHDGTTALDSYGATTGSTMIAAGKKVGAVTTGVSDLKGEHPVSFDYASSVANGDTGLVLESTVDGLGLLVGGKIECASCHDVHNQGTGNYALLQIDNTNSGLCTSCHVK